MLLAKNKAHNTVWITDLWALIEWAWCLDFTFLIDYLATDRIYSSTLRDCACVKLGSGIGMFL